MRPIHRLLAGLGIAAAVLFVHDRHTDSEAFAVNPSAVAPLEMWNGARFTASSVADIKALISRQVSSVQGCERPILWLGNSQLHLVNQFRPGDHVAPYWLRKSLHCAVPLGLSLANANLQEHYVLASAAAAHVPAHMILLELCFDDMREDGLRAEFSGFLDVRARARLISNPVGREIVTRAEALRSKGYVAEAIDGLKGFAQKSVEDRLDAGLSDAWPLWGRRAHLRSQALIDLYLLRNAALGIKATTVRKVIAPRYARNMAALEQLLRDARREGIAVVAYVAPIRQDVPLPYDPVEYGQWKTAMAAMARQYSADFVNLEKLIPPALWGTYYTDDIDFMHFRGEGHALLARALQPHVERVK